MTPSRFPGVPALAVAATMLMTAALGGAQPALAAAASPVFVPCSTTALASALARAVAGETIRLAAGCDYVLTVALPPVSVSLAIEGRGATLERSTAAGTPGFSLLDVSTGDADLSVSGLTFRNGSGGAIDMNGNERLTDNLTVTRSTFTGNTGGAINLGGRYDTSQVAATVTGSVFTGNSGGGINNNGFTLTVTGSTFTGNTGGGINANEEETGSSTDSGPTFITRSTFTGNTGSGITCGNRGEQCEITVTRSVFTRNSDSGINASNDGNVTISVTHTVFRCNTAHLGGGIALDAPEMGDLTATDDVFTGNTATVGGGGIYSFDVAALTGDTFTGNTAPAGGGVENEWFATVTNSVFRGNRSTTNGGGFFNDYSASLSGTMFSHNTASADGGAIYEDHIVGTGSGPSLSITGSRITGNSASGDGGGIYQFGNATLGGTIALAQSTVRNNQPDNCAPLSSVAGCTG